MRIKQVTSVVLSEADVYQAILYYLENKYSFSGTITSFSYDGKRIECVIEIYSERFEKENEYFPFARKENIDSTDAEQNLERKTETKAENAQIAQPVNFAVDDEDF